ncbi:hypothetical protein DSM3645_03198 [Blastopirellula marina DSM 3645]|uniref:Uncharacterized protein n=1 Tax=Blastopirellula marina DSM 3645 TaxID=314230 RepID=A3ZVV3_9BACT|nr:hypothetical protein DSM3645_03198 [Blastopirellula marina DSM 3645]
MAFPKCQQHACSNAAWNLGCWQFALQKS